MEQRLVQDCGCTKQHARNMRAQLRARGPIVDGWAGLARRVLAPSTVAVAFTTANLPVTHPGTPRDAAVISPTVSDGYGWAGPLKGYWYTMTDNEQGGTSTITPACPDPCFESSGPSICVSGEGAEVPDEDSYGEYWGAGIGWSLNQAPEGGEGSELPADLSSYTTLTLDIECNTTSPLRAKLSFGDDSNTCTVLACGRNVLAIGDYFFGECWAGGAQEALDTSLLVGVVALQIQVPTRIGEPTPFDFCVTEASFQ